MFGWFSALDVRLQAAIIAGVVALIGILLKDLVIARWQERRSARQTTVSVYRSYADPLASAATSLLWRLHEIFYRESYYLQPEGEPTIYERYKQISTLYRLARLLGWIRAYQRELTFLPEAEPGKLNTIQEAITKFESALADGSDVELQRLESLSALWGLKLSENEEEKARVANALERVLKRSLHTARIRLATHLEPAAQRELCLKARELLAKELKTTPISDAIFEETLARATQSLSIRESWLYRDFQAGIGDLMIEVSPSHTRRFDVIGYRNFEAMVYEGSDEERRWLQRLANTIESLDISGADRFDARVELLRNTLFATAELVLALTTGETRRSLVSAQTVDVAKKILTKPIA